MQTPASLVPQLEDLPGQKGGSGGKPEPKQPKKGMPEKDDGAPKKRPPGKGPEILNPMIEKLTEGEKQTLHEIHNKYGALSKSPLMFEITGPDTKHDLTLN
jgi:hypothetical protein